MSLNNIDLWTPVTALHCHDPHLFAGISNKLEIYSIPDHNHHVLASYYTKSFQIHGIITQKCDPKSMLAVYGNRYLDLLEYETSGVRPQLELNLLQPQVFMKDWIQTAQFVNKVNIACITANNCLVIYNIPSSSIINLIQCNIKCILYSALLMDIESNKEKYLIASGTVFKQIIIWSVIEEEAKVISCIDGHLGVIFSLEYHKQSKQLFSASDDRSIRIWNHHMDENDDNGWSKSKFNFSHVLYGHEARIWRLLFVNDYLISCGENNSFCIWNAKDGKLMWQNASESSNLWSLAASNKHSLIYLGSSDGSIRVVSLQDKVSISSQNQIHKFAKEAYPTSLILVKNDRLICLTKDGQIILFETSNNLLSIKKCYYLGKDYESYCTAVSDGDYVYCFNQKGDVKVLTNQLFEIAEESLFDGKIFSAFLLSNTSQSIVIVNGPDRNLCAIKDRNLYCHFKLPSSRHPWSSCGFLLDDLIVLGDRNGCINVFEEENCEPIQRLTQVHSCHGVNDLKFNSNTRLILSCGRDGKVNEYSWNSINKQIHFIRYYPINISYDWFDRIIFDGQNVNLIGFYGSKSILWREKERSVSWNMECGGGHRKWDVDINMKEIRFTYIKQGQVVYTCKPLNQFVWKSPLIRPRFHGHKVNCICIVKQLDSTVYLATGGEDNKILIHKYDKQYDKLYYVQTLSGHISSVRTLNCFTEGDKTFLISGGARSQLIVWSISVDSSVFNTKTCTKHLNWKWKDLAKIHWKDFVIRSDTQVRYLATKVVRVLQGLLIISACSDGFLQFFLFGFNSQKITFVYKKKVSEFCPFSLSIINSTLLVGTSDGQIGFWSLNADFEDIIVEDLSINGVNSISCHQSGVNVIECKKLNHDNWIIISSGDDTRLSCLIVSQRKTLEVIRQTYLDSVHSSLISSIILLNNNQIITISIDERIGRWKYLFNEKNEINIEKVNSKTLCQVADASCSAYFDSSDKKSITIIVAGIGFQAFKCSQNTATIKTIKENNSL